MEDQLRDRLVDPLRGSTMRFLRLGLEDRVPASSPKPDLSQRHQRLPLRVGHRNLRRLPLGQQ
jgi:hypothetical protein